ncbi:LLM class flavin-dependent oxidoreductase [Acetobacteraceae bacterium H6797]|nr:LLM class flavin-dependent oxidoreductase [Acetobacteraceae bacterium H6797]
MKLSILDQSTVAEGRGPGEAIRETLALAKLAEDWGYERYWVAEHHNTASNAGSAPEILISAIAATTGRIRVGSAGIMLPHYSPLKIAEQFRALEAIAPGRIDLGLGRAPGSDGRTAFALNPNANESAERFPQSVMELLGWLGEGLPENHPFRSVVANPAVETRPEVWMLGSSDFGAQLAGYLGLPYGYAYFITDGRGAEEAMETYRASFRAEAGRLAAPHASITVFALTAATEAEAWRLFRSRELWRLGRDRGVYAPLPSVEAAEAHAYSEAELARIERIRERAIVGDPGQVAAKLKALGGKLGVQEVAVLTACHDPMARRESYRLLAEAWKG